MDILTDAEIDGLIVKSKIAAKYNKIVDSESAYEILNEKLNEAAKKEDEQKRQNAEEKACSDLSAAPAELIDQRKVKHRKAVVDDPDDHEQDREGGRDDAPSVEDAMRPRRQASLKTSAFFASSR